MLSGMRRLLRIKSVGSKNLKLLGESDDPDAFRGVQGQKFCIPGDEVIYTNQDRCPKNRRVILISGNLMTGERLVDDLTDIPKRLNGRIDKGSTAIEPGTKNPVYLVQNRRAGTHLPSRFQGRRNGSRSGASVDGIRDVYVCIEKNLHDVLP